MTRLLHDRYYRYAPEHAWDLATGESLLVDRLTGAVPRSPVSEPIAEVLEQGRDGEPRWIVVNARGGQSSLRLARRAADHARQRGLVAIAADMYLRLRDVLDEDLRHRTLLIIAPPGTGVDLGRRALIEAAERSPRPHVLLSFRGLRTPRTEAAVVREARSVYAARAAGAPATGPLQSPMADDILRQLSRGERSTALCQEGRHAAAERLLRDVAGALVRRHAFEPAARMQVRLGRILLERGRALDAERIFTEAAGHAQKGGCEELAVEARLWQASARTDAGRLTAAESLCRAALVAGSIGGSLRARAEASLARVLLWQNRVDEAAQCNLRGDHDDQEVHAVAGGIDVRVCVATGDLFAAGQRARELLGLAERSGNALIRVIALVAHLRVLLEAGDVVLGEQCLASVAQAARAARTPFRYVRARLLWVEALRRAGRDGEAERELAGLGRVRRAAPPLLVSAIDGRAHPERRLARPAAPGCAGDVAASMVTMVRDEERDEDALRELLGFLTRSLRTSRVEVWSADAGPDSVIVGVGSGLSTKVGPRVLDAGTPIDDCAGPGGEVGVPVRIGSRLVAALVARWPLDRPVPARAGQLLELAAAVAAPRIDAIQCGAREAAAAATTVPELVGSSAAMIDVRRAIARAASAPFSVLIEGESGSGKELVARALHQLSPRRERRFCDLNCAALPEELVEAELFGHVRGAFTGAVVDRAGLLEDADGGTLFLDEVADLSLRAQAKLLRVLQQQEVRRVGATAARKVDVRVVSAANREMRGEVDAGRFRRDLLYRLDVIRIRVPPLRERPEDVPQLARHFWLTTAPRAGTRAVLSHAVLAALSRYDWPGNVRELQNVMAGLAVAAPASGSVRPALLPSAIAGAASPTTRLVEARDRFERRFIEAALARAGGRRARAARDLGLSRQGLLKMMTRLGITAPEESRTRGHEGSAGDQAP